MEIYLEMSVTQFHKCTSEIFSLVNKAENRQKGGIAFIIVKIFKLFIMEIFNTQQ